MSSGTVSGEIAREIERAGQRSIDRIMRGRKAMLRELLLSSEAKRSKVSCYYLCSECGYLETSNSFPCLSCNSDSWVDLGDEGIAENLRIYENQERRVIPTKAKTINAALTGGVTLGMLASIVLLGSDNVVSIVLTVVFVFWLVAIPAFYFLLLPKIARLLQEKTLAKPKRWRLPISPGELKQAAFSEFSGKIEGSETIRAPFSGKNCQAYRVTIKYDSLQNSRPQETVFSGADSARMRVGLYAFQNGGCLVESDSEIFTASELESNGIDVRGLLRSLGLFYEDGNYSFLESRIEPGNKVRGKFYPYYWLSVVSPAV